MVRLKHRYLLANILYPQEEAETDDQQEHRGSTVPAVVRYRQPSANHLNALLLRRLISDTISLLYGDYGCGVTGSRLHVKYFSAATSTLIVRCPRDHYRLVWAALSFITSLPGQRRTDRRRPCVIQVVRVSGTIKKAEEELIKRARETILKAKNAGNDEILNTLLKNNVALPQNETLDDTAGDSEEEEDDTSE